MAVSTSGPPRPRRLCARRPAGNASGTRRQGSLQRSRRRCQRHATGEEKVTRFLDVRLQSVGGGLAASMAIHEGTALANYQSLPLAQLLSDIRGRHVLIGTHGFNVNRQNGIAGLSSWEGLLTLDPPSVFIGL